MPLAISDQVSAGTTPHKVLYTRGPRGAECRHTDRVSCVGTSIELGGEVESVRLRCIRLRIHCGVCNLIRIHISLDSDLTRLRKNL